MLTTTNRHHAIPPAPALAMDSAFVADAPIFRSVLPQQGYGSGIRQRQPRIAFSRDGYSGPDPMTSTRTAANRITEYLVGGRLQTTTALVPFQSSCRQINKSSETATCCTLGLLGSGVRIKVFRKQKHRVDPPPPLRGGMTPSRSIVCSTTRLRDLGRPLQ